MRNAPSNRRENGAAMRLTKINYSQFKGSPQQWLLSDLLLGQSNLIVGKNASGKSRTLSIIRGLGMMLSGKQKPEFQSGNYDAVFDDEGKTVRYCLEYMDRKVVREEVTVDGKQLLVRGAGGKGEIFHEKEKKKLEFQTPETDLAAFARRDSIQHSFLEPLGEWGAGVRHYAFGGLMGREHIALLVKDGPEADPADANAVIGLFRKGEKDHPDAFAEAVRQDMCAIDYPLDSVGVRSPTMLTVQSPFTVAPTVLFVKEADLPCETEQFEMSQGMFRALAIVIHINYAILASKPSCMVIDDIGEGLDFDRSCKLIDLVRRKVRQSTAQLIMTTNDRFVMNKVPLKEWSVLQRAGDLVDVRNYENSKQIFDEFEYTGLSNFDFFATDFLDEKAKEEVVAHE